MTYWILGNWSVMQQSLAVIYCLSASTLLPALIFSSLAILNIHHITESQNESAWKGRLEIILSNSFAQVGPSQPGQVWLPKAMSR